MEKIANSEQELDAEIKRILALSDDEVWAEAVKECGSIEAAQAEADKVGEIIKNAVAAWRIKQQGTIIEVTGCNEEGCPLHVSIDDPGNSADYDFECVHPECEEVLDWSLSNNKMPRNCPLLKDGPITIKAKEQTDGKD